MVIIIELLAGLLAVLAALAVGVGVDYLFWKHVYSRTRRPRPEVCKAEINLGGLLGDAIVGIFETSAVVMGGWFLFVGAHRAGEFLLSLF